MPPETNYNIVIRNNVAISLLEPRNVTLHGVTVDHNLFVKNADKFADDFVNFDPEHFKFDMHPSKDSPVIGAGSPDGAPVDIDGHPRHSPIDVGAFAACEIVDEIIAFGWR